jgi:uncharacterized membrane protein
VIAIEGGGALLLIALMALVTLLTRVGGVLLMSFVPMSRRVEGFINAMAGSVLVAVLVPVAVKADGAGQLALLMTAVLMLLFRRPMPAIAAGILVAALVRAV